MIVITTLAAIVDTGVFDLFYLTQGLRAEVSGYDQGRPFSLMQQTNTSSHHLQ